MPRPARLLLTGVLALVPWTAGADEQAAFRAASAPAISAESERALHAAFEHVYNLEFGPALEQFAAVARAEPESAAVRAFWASAVLYEILARQGTLRSQLFVTSNEFLKHERLPPDPALDRRFQELAAETETLARRRLEKNKNDTDALFALGLVYGSRANYAAGVKAKYFDGLRLGEKAYDYHKKLVKLRPELHDTGVVLGVHDYILGSLPSVHRFFLFFAGVRGSRERGLAYFEEVAARGEFLRTYGQVLLGVALIREEQLERALKVAEDLRARYPRNPIFGIELARLYRQMERYPEAARACRDLLAELIAHPHNPRVIGPEDALLELALVEDAQGEPYRALESLREVDRIPGASSRVRARAFLERGKIFDRLGQRDHALAEYKKVIALAAYAEATRLALAYSRDPYQPLQEN